MSRYGGYNQPLQQNDYDVLKYYPQEARERAMRPQQLPSDNYDRDGRDDRRTFNEARRERSPSRKGGHRRRQSIVEPPRERPMQSPYTTHVASSSAAPPALDRHGRPKYPTSAAAPEPPLYVLKRRTIGRDTRQPDSDSLPPFKSPAMARVDATRARDLEQPLPRPGRDLGPARESNRRSVFDDDDDDYPQAPLARRKTGLQPSGPPMSLPVRSGKPRTAEPTSSHHRRRMSIVEPPRQPDRYSKRDAEPTPSRRRMSIAQSGDVPFALPKPSGHGRRQTREPSPVRSRPLSFEDRAPKPVSAAPKPSTFDTCIVGLSGGGTSPGSNLVLVVSYKGSNMTELFQYTSVSGQAAIYVRRWRGPPGTGLSQTLGEFYGSAGSFEQFLNDILTEANTKGKTADPIWLVRRWFHAFVSKWMAMDKNREARSYMSRREIEDTYDSITDPKPLRKNAAFDSIFQ